MKAKFYVMVFLFISISAKAEKNDYGDLFLDGIRVAEGSNLDKQMVKKAKALCSKLNEFSKDEPNKMDALIDWDLSKCQEFHKMARVNPSGCSDKKNNLARVFVRSALTKACSIK
ncbi:MAG: hypothetical protein H7235_04340 [Bdellovibrionaceae bacterium]|nr:hypothetical protein [Pseudobdellovibrionaceae bacterium]